MKAFLLTAVMLLSLALVPTAVASESQPTLAEIESEVVCPTCHTTLDQSSSAVADRMRTFIRARIAAGDTKSEIKRKLVDGLRRAGARLAARSAGSTSSRGCCPPCSSSPRGRSSRVLAVRWSRRRDPAPADEAAPADPALDRRIDDELARLDG